MEISKNSMMLSSKDGIELFKVRERVKRRGALERDLRRADLTVILVLNQVMVTSRNFIERGWSLFRISATLRFLVGSGLKL